MQEYCSDALGRKTDLVACYLRYRNRMLDKRFAVAALMLLQGFRRYIVCLEYELLTGLIIPWEQFVYILSHDFQTLRYCCKTHISSRYFAAAWKSSSAAAFSMLRFACSTAFSTCGRVIERITGS